MARFAAMEKGGFYPFPEDYQNDVLRLFVPNDHDGARILDPCAGEGVALEAAASAWKLTPYAIELDYSRSQQCQIKFGAEHAFQDDLFKAKVSPGSFVAVWNNPPYTQDRYSEAKRREFDFLKFAWRYLQSDGWMIFISYAQHLTEAVCHNLVENARTVDVYRLPELHLGQYIQTVVIAQAGKGKLDNAPAVARQLYEQAQFTAEMGQKMRHGVEPDEFDLERMLPDIAQAESGIYTFPEPSTRRKKAFQFAPSQLSPAMITRSVQELGPHLGATFGLAATPKPQERELTPVIQPRARQLAGLLAAGVFNGLDLSIKERGRAAVRSTVHQVEKLVENEEKKSGTRQTWRIVPEVHITLLYADGSVEDITGDSALSDFIWDHKEALLSYVATHFNPLYQFDFINDVMKRFLEATKLTNEFGVFDILSTQKHVIAASYARLKNHRGLIIAGEPGVGKTLQAIALMEAMKFRSQLDEFRQLYQDVSRRKRMRPDQFNVIVCPPHLVDKWKREIHNIDPDAHVGAIKSGEGTKPIEEVQAFVRGLDRVDEQGFPAVAADTLKVLVISREMVKAGEGWRGAINWTNRYRAIEDDETEAMDFIREDIPICPTTGLPAIKFERQGNPVYLNDIALNNRQYFHGLKSNEPIPRGLKKYRHNHIVNPAPGAYLEALAGAMNYQSYAEMETARTSTDSYYRDIYQRRHALWKKKHRSSRRSNEREHAPHLPLWQECRTFSSIHKDKTVPEVLGEAMGLKHPVVPLPGVVDKYLDKADYLPSKNPRAMLTGVAKLLADRYGDRIYLAIFDEYHEYQDRRSAQSRAMTRIANAATKVVGMTGTLYGGRASSLFTLEQTVNPQIRERYPWEGKGETHWIQDMGVLEYTIEEKEGKGKSGRNSDRKIIQSSPREIPGASPLLLKEVLDHTIFVGLKDLGKAMPPFEEQGRPVQMGVLAPTYYETQKYLTEYLNNQRMKGDSSFLGAYFQSLLNWPNYPFEPYQVWHRRKIVDKITEEVTEIEDLVMTIPPVDPGVITPKERWLINTVKAELLAGRGVGVYLTQTGGKRRLSERLLKLIQDNIPQARPVILKSSVPTGRREAWLRKNNQANILICNPNLVKTGLDLVQFQTLIFFEVAYSLYTMDQASRRAWRLIQTLPCRVLFPYYQMEEGKADTMESKGVVLVSQKREAAAFLYGTEGASLTALVEGGGGSLRDELARVMDKEMLVDASQLFKRAAQAEAVEESDWYDEETDEDEDRFVEIAGDDPMPGIAEAEVIVAAETIIAEAEEIAELCESAPLVQLSLFSF